MNPALQVFLNWCGFSAGFAVFMLTLFILVLCAAFLRGWLLPIDERPSGR